MGASAYRNGGFSKAAGAEVGLGVSSRLGLVIRFSDRGRRWVVCSHLFNA